LECRGMTDYPNTGDIKYTECPRSVDSVVKFDYMTTKGDGNIKSLKEEHRKLRKKSSNVCVYVFFIIT
jgi:hypothetical protein